MTCKQCIHHGFHEMVMGGSYWYSGRIPCFYCSRFGGGEDNFEPIATVKRGTATDLNKLVQRLQAIPAFHDIIGTCSECKGPVTISRKYGGAGVQPRICSRCGRMAVDYGPVIKTAGPTYEEQICSGTPISREDPKTQGGLSEV